jgi:hypothetical protein
VTTISPKQAAAIAPSRGTSPRMMPVRPAGGVAHATIRKPATPPIHTATAARCTQSETMASQPLPDPCDPSVTAARTPAAASIETRRKDDQRLPGPRKTAAPRATTARPARPTTCHPGLVPTRNGQSAPEATASPAGIANSNIAPTIRSATAARRSTDAAPIWARRITADARTGDQVSNAATPASSNAASNPIHRTATRAGSGTFPAEVRRDPVSGWPTEKASTPLVRWPSERESTRHRTV